MVIESYNVNDVLCVFVTEATERRAAVDRQASPSQLPTALMALEGMASYRRIEEAFHCKLKGPVVVDKKTLTELQNFQTVRFCRTMDMFMENYSILLS